MQRFTQMATLMAGHWTEVLAKCGERSSGEAVSTPMLHLLRSCLQHDLLYWTGNRVSVGGGRSDIVSNPNQARGPARSDILPLLPSKRFAHGGALDHLAEKLSNKLGHRRLALGAFSR